MTDEQQERLKQIRERVRRLEQSADDPHVKDWGGAYYGDVYFLLSLIDSQAAGDKKAVALRKIADQVGAPNVCECEHDDGNCCARVEYYCPACIAAVAIGGNT